MKTLEDRWKDYERTCLVHANDDQRFAMHCGVYAGVAIAFELFNDLRNSGLSVDDQAVEIEAALCDIERFERIVKRRYLAAALRSDAEAEPK